jgi:hypothetical protein
MLLILELLKDVISTAKFGVALNMAQVLTTSKFVRVQKEAVMANLKALFWCIMNMLREFVYIVSE